MATGKSDDELIQLDNKMRIWARSGKFRKVENPELSMARWQSMTRTPMTSSMIDCVTLHDADVNDNINDCVALHDADVNDNINGCVALHDAYTTERFHWHPHERSAHSLSLIESCPQHHIICTRTVAQDVWVLSQSFPRVHGPSWVFLLDLILPFYFLHFLTSLIFFLQFLKFMVNLHTPPNESMDSSDEFSLSTVCAVHTRPSTESRALLTN